MTKNRSMKIAVLVLALALITACFVGTTFAKYVSTATGEGTAQVALWDVKVSGNTITADVATQSFEFDLFEESKVYDVTVADPAGPDTATTNEETDVADNRIAPGTTGSFSFTLENDSEVNAAYTIDFEMESTGADVPLLFRVGDSGEFKTIDQIEVVNNAFTMNAEATTVEVQWIWDFDAQDDTALGLTPPTVTIKANLEITQVN